MAAARAADVPVLERVGTPVTGRLPAPPLRSVLPFGPPPPRPPPLRGLPVSPACSPCLEDSSDLYALYFPFHRPEEGRDPVAGGFGGGGSRGRRRRRECWQPSGLGSEWVGAGGSRCERAEL